MNSNRKGKVGERELAKVLREHGYECRRSQQYAGGVEESADIVGLPYIHIECKRVEKLNIYEAVEQSFGDAQDEWHQKLIKGIEDKTTIPIVAHRKNSKDWLVTMYLDDWMELYKEFEAGKAMESK